MKRAISAGLAMLFMLGTAIYVYAAEPNRDAIKKKVDDVVAAINGGKSAADFQAAAKEDPYIFIMKDDGFMEVHPSLAGKNIKGGDMDVIYKELSKADANGLWVKYQWQGKEKNSYVRKTKAGLIVGSGY